MLSIFLALYFLLSVAHAFSSPTTSWANSEAGCRRSFKGGGVSLAAASGHREERRPIDLTVDFEGKTPVAALKELSEVAEAFGIQQQDVYGGGAQWMADFEAEVASRLGKEAAMFCPSGVMAQLIALKVHGSGRRGSASGGAGIEPESFLCHPSSHMLLHEEGAHEKLVGFGALPVGVMERPASLEDLRRVLDEVCPDEGGDEGRLSSPPACFVLELPHRELGGACTPGEEVKAMSELLKARGVAFHCDGARIWEACPWYGGSLDRLCESFDSVYVSFYKGLGGMTGAMLVGTTTFIAEARPWLRRFGGNVFTSLPYAVSCYHAFVTQVDSFQERWDKLRRVTALIDDLSSSMGPGGGAGPIVRFEPVEPQCSMVHCYLRGTQAVLERSRDEVLQETGVKVFRRLRGIEGRGAHGRPGECYFEWNMGPANGSIRDEVFLGAWRAFLGKVMEYGGSQGPASTEAAFVPPQ